MGIMNWRGRRREMLKDFETRLESEIAQMPAKVEALLLRRHTRQHMANTAAWLTGGVAVLAAGVYAGRELRSRYKFKRRTPYDFYAHSGDHVPDVEFGVGI